MASFFSRLKSAAKAALQAFRKPKTAPPQATPPKTTPPKPTPPKAKNHKPNEWVSNVKTMADVRQRNRYRQNQRISELQKIQLNASRDEASTFYAATVNLWNVPEGTTTEFRNQLIVNKLGVENLEEAYKLVMTRYHELNSGDVDDSVSPPPGLTQLQTELAARVSGYETT